jgi:Tannase and feruloyl esterase
MVFDNPAWDFRTVNAERALQIADEKTAQIVNATDADLRRFTARRGKLILYHGWSHAGVPGLSTVNYYETAMAKLRLPTRRVSLDSTLLQGCSTALGGPGLISSASLTSAVLTPSSNGSRQ